MRTLFVALVLAPLISFSQDNDSTLRSNLAKGKFSVHARTFFMATINERELTDYYGLAIGAGMGYESPEIKNFRIGISGFFIYNIASSDLSKPDPQTNIMNRYEIGLFDITDPNNHRDLDRLEELFLQYRVHKSFVRAGKVILNTPFINPQDGRMRPTLEQGLTVEINEIKDVKIEGAYIDKISPRSTVKWYSVGESIGIYPQGLSSTGSRSQYAGHVESEGVYLLGINYKHGISIALWDTYIDNISNTALMQLEHTFLRTPFYFGLQYVRQDVVGNGGNRDEAYAYMDPGTYTNTVSSRVGRKKNNLDVNINATITSGNGRYLMPREWGRDPFFTFMPRERIEGAGSVKAASMNISYTSLKKHLRYSVGIGHFVLPDVQDYWSNKYAMPSFTQLNLDLRYSFQKYLEGASIQLLYVYKLNGGEDYENPKNVINKVNMSNVNLVFNYQFETSHSRRTSGNHK